jgi:hypothetical protein
MEPAPVMAIIYCIRRRLAGTLAHPITSSIVFARQHLRSGTSSPSSRIAEAPPLDVAL